MGVLQDIQYRLDVITMSFSRRDGIAKVNSLLNTIILYLVKIAVYKTTNKDREEQVSHWRGEITEWLLQIYEYCGNLKHGNKLRLRDYLNCLRDDLGRESLVHIKVMRCNKLYPSKCLHSVDYETLRQYLWGILEIQFTAMANERWQDSTLDSHLSFKQLVEHGFES